MNSCEICGKPSGKGKVCGKTCASRKRRGTVLENFCKICGKPVALTTGRPQFCEEHLVLPEHVRRGLTPEGRLTKLLSNAKLRSKRKDLDFDLDLPFLLNLWNLQEGKCALSGRPLDLESWGSKGQVNPNAPSIDKIVPAKGYTKGNVRLLTYHCNVCVNEYGDDELFSLLEDIRRGRSRR
jgi:hypothetical protein